MTAARWAQGLRVARRWALLPSVRFAWFAGLALCAAWPLLSTAAALNDFRDSQVLFQYEESARKTVAEFGQIPWWNPYYCGGLYGLGTPQSRFASPTLLLTLVFGTARAEALTALAFLLIGLEGTFRYLRSRGARGLGALLAAPAFALSGVFACAPFLGWTNFYGFELLPWALLGVRRALRGRTAGLALAAAAVAWMVGFGGTYAVPLTAVLCAAEVVERLVHRPRWQVVTAAAATAFLCAGMAAYRLWPVWETLSRAPRVLGGMSGNEWRSLPGLLLGYWPWFHPPVAWYLVGAGVIPAGLAGAARRRSIPLLLGVFACLWLALGYQVVPSLFALLRRIPPYEMLRYPERFLIPLALLVAVLAAKGLSVLAARARRRRWARPAWAACAAVLAANLSILMFNFRAAAAERTMVSPPVEVDRPFHQARGNRWAAAYYGPMSRGSLSCWEAYPVPQAPALRGDLASEEYLKDAAAGTAVERRWSPNRLDLSVHLTQPTRLLVNQNHHTGWKANVGAVVNDSGLLAVDLPAGDHEVTLKFLPRSGVAGGLTTLAAIIAGVALAWPRKGRAALGPAAVLALAAGPLGVGAFAAALMPEPAFVRSALDVPLVADSPPAEARRLDATFEGGVVLEASSVSENVDEHTVRLELDWKVAGPVAPHLGFFLHVEPADGSKRLTADHPMVSDALFLEEAPKGKTLRDVVVLSVPPEHRKLSWNLWAGLWAVRGDGARMKVLSPGKGRVSEDRIHVGAVERK